MAQRVSCGGTGGAGCFARRFGPYTISDPARRVRPPRHDVTTLRRALTSCPAARQGQGRGGAELANAAALGLEYRHTHGIPAPMITVFGSLNMDLVMTVPALPRPGETVLTDTYATKPGGTGNNQAVAAEIGRAHV